MKRILACLMLLMLAAASGCSRPKTPAASAPTATPAAQTPEPPAETAPVAEENPDGAATIVFGADGASIDGTGAHTVGDGVRIDTGGSYTVSGDNGHAAVSVFAPGKHVQITLDGASLYNGNGPALELSSASDVELILGSNESKIQTRSDREAALRSEVPLTISGGGTLSVSNPNGGAVLVRNYLTVNSGRLMLSALTDGIEINSGGVFTMNDGSLYINAQTNGINVQRDITVQGGSLFSFAGTQNNGSGFLAGGQLLVNGGNVVSAGSFMKTPAGSQPAVVFEFGQQPSGTTFNVSDASGSLASFETPGASRAVLYSNPQLQAGGEYSLSAGDSVIATAAATAG